MLFVDDLIFPLSPTQRISRDLKEVLLFDQVSDSMKKGLNKPLSSLTFCKTLFLNGKGARV